MPLTQAEIDERQKFSSGGRTYWLILRGLWGIKVDRVIVRWTTFWNGADDLGRTPLKPS